MKHAHFVNRFEASKYPVKLVHNWLNARGFKSEIIPSTVAKSYEDRWNHVDDGDICTTVQGVNCRIEVKGINTNFDSVKSFPYPFIFVDEEYKIRKQHKLPLCGYAIVNKQKSGFIAIPARTKPHWKPVTKFDSKMQQDRTYVQCPKNILKYYEL